VNTWFRVGDDGCITLNLHVQPGAKTTGCAGLHGDALKIRLAAPPVDGRANAALLRFVADVLKLPPAAIVLKSGRASRRKVVEVSGATREAVAALSQPS
jgi:uncharacterized protein (TIGR00251 family)